MDVAVSRRNHTNKRGNKENTQPTHGSKSLIKRDKPWVAPFHLKGNEKGETMARSAPPKATAKQTDTRSTSGDALKKVKTVQRDGKGAAAADAQQRQTHSQAFLTEQAVRHRKIVAEASKPPAAVPTSKSAPGMYKGKIVESKIGSIWKTSASVGAADLKPSAPKTEGQRFGNVAKSRSKSAAEMPGRGAHKPAPTRSKSVSDRPAQVSKPAVSSRPPARFNSARPPTRTVPATQTTTSSRNTTVAPTKASAPLKPKIPVTDRKVSKPAVSSTLSQYRLTVETAEERRAKLADWIASKGKSLKRPAMITAAPPKTKVSAKSGADLKPQPAAQPEPEASVEADCAAAQCAEQTAHSRTPVIMNTTLDLLENSDVDLPVDPQDRVDDIVVNLCDALEAMATPSRCSDELPHECNDVEMEGSAVDESKREELSKVEAEESDDQKVKTDVEEVESGDEGVMATTPQMKDASVIKYSVKTTPYLQSVKKTIENEASTSTSRKKGNIKDLKFLTPVRRSCRIERKSSCLPPMLADHDPCVSSLAELLKLDDDPNAYIYRKNSALVEDLPDQPRL